jgi:MFS family permease
MSQRPLDATDGLLPARTAVLVFLSFALAYFLSALVRAITATLSPTLSAEFALQASDLGLLAGGYFLGFSLTQLPLGNWLDRLGPKRVILGFLALAVLGVIAFALAGQFATLLAARVLTGMGVSACLMAPLTGFRRWLTPAAQLRANAWMLMTGSLGMLASTLPVQWLMPWVGWRGLFWGLAGLIALAALVLAWAVPRWDTGAPAADGHEPAPPGYGAIWRNRYFQRMTPIGFFCYGGMLAVQTLWAGPWMVRVAGDTSAQAAQGLFWINAFMLVTFWTWGLVNPTLVRRGLSAQRLIALGLPLSFVVLVVNIALGEGTGWLGWALYCVSSTFITLSQPAVALAFVPALAGRALSAFNLVIFSGVFVVQWGIGLLVDAFQQAGWSVTGAFQAAFAVYLACCVLSYLYFLAVKAEGHAPTPARQVAGQAR